MEKKKRGRSEKLVSSVRQSARDQAEQEARRVPWQLLVEARNQYLDWQEFYYWARSIMESEDGIPNWLAKKLDELCPGFLAEEKQYLARHPNEASLTPVRLGHWIDEHIFSFAQQGAWLLAVTFYAVRESRYQKASVCWSESVEKWRKARPIQYPSFEQWRREAGQCNETARLLPRVRKERACFALVDPERLAQAVARFIEWEAFAYWLRLPLEKGDCFPIELTRELNSRCPGFVEFNNQERPADRHIPQDWAAEEFSKLAPPPLPVSPSWSPVKEYGGYAKVQPEVVGAPHSASCSHIENSAPGRTKSHFQVLGDLSLCGLGCDCFAF